MSASFPDHYAVLGLDRRCSLAQIRAAYRVLVKRHHPDVNREDPGATARAQALNAAHDILSEPARRAAYDRERAEFERTRRDTPPKRMAGKVERNIAHDVHLRFEDFLRGVSLEVKINDPANPGGPEMYPLVVPADTAPGARFRLPRDAPFEGGFVVVRVKARAGARFKVRGSDLRADLRISARRAAHGGAEMMTGATGRMVRVVIPAGVARGAIVRLAGEGLPKSRGGGRGDLLVRVTYRPEVGVTRRQGSFDSEG